MPDLSSILSQFIREGTTGVIDAERDAAADRLAFKRRLDDPPSAFITPGDVDGFLRDRFPPFEHLPEDLLAQVLNEETLDVLRDEWEPGETAIRPGALYIHPERFPLGDLGETPPVERVLGVRIDSANLEIVDGVALVTAAAVEQVRETVERYLGERRKRVYKEIATEGYPRPVVDDLSIEAALTFTPALTARTVDARAAGSLVPEAVGRITTDLHFESD